MVGAPFESRHGHDLARRDGGAIRCKSQKTAAPLVVPFHVGELGGCGAGHFRLQGGRASLAPQAPAEAFALARAHVRVEMAGFDFRSERLSEVGDIICGEPEFSQRDEALVGELAPSGVVNRRVGAGAGEREHLGLFPCGEEAGGVGLPVLLRGGEVGVFDQGEGEVVRVAADEFSFPVFGGGRADLDEMVREEQDHVVAATGEDAVGFALDGADTGDAPSACFARGARHEPLDTAVAVVGRVAVERSCDDREERRRVFAGDFQPALEVVGAEVQAAWSRGGAEAQVGESQRVVLQGGEAPAEFGPGAGDGGGWGGIRGGGRRCGGDGGDAGREEGRQEEGVEETHRAGRGARRCRAHVS